MLKSDIDKAKRLWRVSVITPAGRKQNLEILKKYVYRDMAKGLIDEWQLWLNTDNQDDIDYIRELEKENSKIKIFTVDGIVGHYGYTIANFFKFANNLNTIYIRLDDDIVWVEEGALEKLAIARFENSLVKEIYELYPKNTEPEPFVISANVVNNTLGSAIHQEIGVLSKEAGIQTRTFNDATFCKKEFFNLTHETFKNKLEDGKLSDYYFPDIILTDYQQFSINCFAFFAKDLMFITDIREEPYIWGREPKRLGRPNMIKGDALVVHGAYGCQRYFENEKKWIDYYKQLSEKI